MGNPTDSENNSTGPAAIFAPRQINASRPPPKPLQQIRDILTSIVQEAGNRGMIEIAELAGRADKLATELLGQET